jgi:hypothetical protein
MRGQRIFNDIIKGRGLNGTVTKGRNNRLVAKRNECLVARYYYYGHFKNKCYEEILRLLVAEFFLSPGTIANIIQNNTEQLQAIKQNAMVMFYFQNHWPHLKW